MPFTPDQPCQNLSCKSFGHVHPNCRCFAEGGSVCAGSHREACEHFADGGTLQAHQEFASNPDLAIDHAVTQNGLLHTLSRSGYTKSEAPGRAHSEFLDHHKKGRKTLHSHAESLLDPKAPPYKPDATRAEALQSKLNELQSNPGLALNIGGDLGDTLPMHHAALAAKAGTAITYLNSIKPKPLPGAPLDPMLAPSKFAEKEYRRQVAIAEDPRLVLHYIKQGTVVPQDLGTLSTLYPKLRQQLQDKAFEMLASAEASGKHLSHKQKRHLGILLGQPVMLQQTPAAIAAIMHANAPAQMPQPAAKQPRKTSDAELRQINKVDQMAQTPLQRLQARQK